MSNLYGTNISATIKPFTTADKFPTHEAQYGKGGYRTVNSENDLTNIPIERIEKGMLAYVRDTNKIYKYKGNETSPVTLNDWSELQISGSEYYTVVDTITDRDSIQNPDIGTLVYVTSDNNIYKYTSDNTWELINEPESNVYVIVDTYGDLSSIEQPFEGMLAYTKDTDKVYKYIGNNRWVPIAEEDGEHLYFVVESDNKLNDIPDRIQGMLAYTLDDNRIHKYLGNNTWAYTDNFYVVVESFNELTLLDDVLPGTLGYVKDTNDIYKYINNNSGWEIVTPGNNNYQIVNNLSDISNPPVGTLAYVIGQDTVYKFTNNGWQLLTSSSNEYYRVVNSYANLPTLNVNIGTLGYTRDTNQVYKYTNVGWVILEEDYYEVAETYSNLSSITPLEGTLGYVKETGDVYKYTSSGWTLLIGADYYKVVSNLSEIVNPEQGTMAYVKTSIGNNYLYGTNYNIYTYYGDAWTLLNHYKVVQDKSDLPTGSNNRFVGQLAFVLSENKLYKCAQDAYTSPVKWVPLVSDEQTKYYTIVDKYSDLDGLVDKFNGMIAYTKNTNQFFYYSGSNWVEIQSSAGTKYYYIVNTYSDLKENNVIPHDKIVPGLLGYVVNQNKLYKCIYDDNISSDDNDWIDNYDWVPVVPEGILKIFNSKNSVTVDHELNKKYPNVTIIETVGNQDFRIYGDIEFIDNNQLKVTFSQSISGKIYVS